MDCKASMRLMKYGDQPNDQCRCKQKETKNRIDEKQTVVRSINLYNTAKQHARRQDDGTRFQQSEKQMSKTDLFRIDQKKPETADQAGSKSIDHEIRPHTKTEMFIDGPEKSQKG